MGIGLFSQVIKIGCEVMALSCVKGDAGWILGKISSPRSSQALAWTVWGVGESSSLEVFQDSGDVALRDVISERSGGGLGLDLEI